VFESPELESLIKEHKTVAILPLKLKLHIKKQPKISVEANRDQELKMSKSIQSYVYLLKNRFLYSSFQDVEKTNILLKKRIADKLDEMTKDEVAKALGMQ
jgi:hypothetical protein